MIKILAYLATGFALLVGAIAVSWVIFMPNNEQRGIWRLNTGGVLIELTPIVARLYSESSHSCYENLVFPAHLKLVELLEGATVTIEDGDLILSVDGSLDPRRFERIDALPANCIQTDPSTATARDVYDAAWTAMNEHYAFFDLHGVDWAARQSGAPAPDVVLTEDEIEEMLLTLTTGLDDGHVHFGTDKGGYASPAMPPPWMPKDGSITRDSLRANAVANAGVDLISVEDAPLLYGLRPDGIGIILIDGMDVNTPIGGTSTKAMADVFAAVLADLSDARALIIDVRYNPGGSDTVSLGIAGHFTGKQTPVFTKTTRDGADQTLPFTAMLLPADDTPDLRPIVVITSRLTGSAAEIFTLAMRELPQVTVLGEPTSGGLSDVMGFVLPNGWGLGLSNQTYLTLDGELYEAIGIPPDITVDYSAAPFARGEDPILAQAIATAVSMSQ